MEKKQYRIRFVPLGGVSDVTKNMYLYELYVKSSNNNFYLQEIVIVDCGIGFPKSQELGVDFVIPDISYLLDKIEKIKGIILTHGHEDHISALPYHLASLNSPPIFASRLTKGFLENKFSEFGIRSVVNEIKYSQPVRLGSFEIEFIPVTHSIPDTVHLLIKTPVGVFYHGTDFKFDLTPPYGQPPDFYKITKAGKEGVLCLLSDCLGVEREGLTLSEKVVGLTFENEMRQTKGKFIMTTFSSNVSRIRQCFEAAVKFNRKVCFLGRSMKENTKKAKELGYLPPKESFLIDETEIKKYPQNKLCLIVAGSQGQSDSAMAKLSRDQNPNVKIVAGDRIVFSSDPIPGNEEEVYGLIEDLIIKGAEVIYPVITDQLHASGHGNEDDLKFLIRFTNPSYFIPIGGTIRHQRQYQRLVEGLGYPKERVFILFEGDTVWFEKNRAYLGEKVETKNVYVDAYGIGDVGRVVLQDRQQIAAEGIVVVILSFDHYGCLTTAPKIVSRGFIFEKENKDLYQKAVNLIQRLTKPKGQRRVNLLLLKKEITKSLESLFFEEIGRKPLVVVEIIGI